MDVFICTTLPQKADEFTHENALLKIKTTEIVIVIVVIEIEIERIVIIAIIVIIVTIMIIVIHVQITKSLFLRQQILRFTVRDV